MLDLTHMMDTLPALVVAPSRGSGPLVNELRGMTEPLPVLVTASIAWEDVPSYAPSLLLDRSRFPLSQVETADFQEGCEDGYDAFFEFDDESDSDAFFQPRVFTTEDVCSSVHAGVLSFFAELNMGSCPFPWFIGFSFGWLSALAAFQPREAASGLAVLLSLAGAVDTYHFVEKFTARLRGVRPR